MAMQYINYIKAKAHLATAHKAEAPVLSEEDEQFLHKVVSQENPPPLPARPKVEDLIAATEAEGKDAQVALLDGAQNIPLPETPQELTEEPTNTDVAGALETSPKKTASKWSWLRRDSRDATSQESREATASGLGEIVQKLKADENISEEEKMAKKEEEDMTIMLERLNLAAVNNRAFSISTETHELLQQFNVVLKDLINGVPTAYDDLESLLTNGDRQLQKTFNSLPTFLQQLIEKLPESMTKGFAPEMMAAASERADKSGLNMENAGKAAAAASKLGIKTPTLKELLGKPAAATGLLRSIIGYLRARFPAFMGMNVLWSLALFVLLFVFWYCHKRGREARLEKESELIEKEVQDLDVQHRADHPGEIPSASMGRGAPVEQVETTTKETGSANQTTPAVQNTEPTKTVDLVAVPPTTVP